MKLSITFLAFFLLFSGNAWTQPYSSFLGASGKDLIAQVIPSGDGNYYAVGSKTIGAFSQAWLLKMDASGAILWEKTFPTVAAEQNGIAHNLTILPDGNLMITGEERSTDFFNSGTAFAYKVDGNGNVFWKRTYAQVSALFDALQVGSNFYLVGLSEPLGSTNGGLLMLINSNGILQWKQPIDVYNQTRVKKIFPTDDGNFILIGRTNVIGAGFEGVFLRKVTPNGDQIWQSTFDTGFRERDYFSQEEDFYNQPLGVARAADGSFWITNPIGYNPNITLLHVSATGNLLDQKNYGSPDQNEYPYSVSILSDGSLLITGESKYNDYSVESKSFAMCLDPSGLEKWRNYYGSGLLTESLFSGQQTADGNLLLAGMSNKPDPGSHGGLDGWVLNLPSDGNALPWQVSGKVVFDLNQNCIADPGEPPAKGWFVALQDTANRLEITNAQGEFLFPTDNGNYTLSVLAPTPTNEWTFCANNIAVESNSQHPVSNNIILVKPLDPGCSKTEVSITQPDLVRCNTSTFCITVRNRGTGDSEGMQLELSLDPDLSIVTATEPFGVSGDKIYFEILPMAGLSEKNISFAAKLACNTQLGATHTAIVRLEPLDCAGNSTAAWYSVDGRCDDSQVKFELKNIGGGGANAHTRYRVMSDDLLAQDYTPVSLPEGGTPVSLAFPADGRTWRVELEDGGWSNIRYPAASVEGCGTGKNGLYSIDFENAWRFEERAPDISAVLAPNTTGTSPRVVPATTGFGFYYLIGDLNPLEFTARAANPNPLVADEVEFRLFVNKNLDIQSFEPLAYNGPVEYSLDNNGVLRIKMLSVQIAPGEEAMVRFRIRPKSGIIPDDGPNSLFLVEGAAYFNKIGPVALAAGYLNLSTTFPDATDEYNNYTGEVLTFGGRLYDFSTGMAASPNGDVFLVGETNSYNGGTGTDGLIIKTNASGKAYWLNAIDLGDKQLNFFKDVALAPNYGCLAVGNWRKINSPNGLADYQAFVANIDATGNMTWHRKFRPGGKGAWVNGIVPTGAGEYVMFGYAANGDNGVDQFYQKIDANGTPIWETYDSIDGSAFKPQKAIVTNDGSLVAVGTNNSTFLDFDVYLEKIGANGQLIWRKGFNPADYYVSPNGIAPTPDNGFLVSGYSQWMSDSNYVTTPSFIKFNASGEFEWEKRPLISPFGYCSAYNLIPAPGGGYLVTGEVYYDTTAHHFDFLLLKIDEDANLEWWNHYGAKNTESADALAVSASGEVLIWGNNQRRAPLYNLQSLLVRADQAGQPLVGNKPEIQPETTFVDVAPNPVDNMLHVRVTSANGQDTPWQLIDLSGKIAGRGVVTGKSADISVRHFPPGMYFLQFPALGKSVKIVVQ